MLPIPSPSVEEVLLGLYQHLEGVRKERHILVETMGALVSASRDNLKITELLVDTLQIRNEQSDTLVKQFDLTAASLVLIADRLQDMTKDLHNAEVRAQAAELEAGEQRPLIVLSDIRHTQ